MGLVAPNPIHPPAEPKSSPKKKKISNPTPQKAGDPLAAAALGGFQLSSRWNCPN